jgi:2-oxoglutarate dehydrogenase E1 component
MGHVKSVEDSLVTDKKTLAVLIHGDAAVAGQGIVYECLQMSYLKHYQTFGVIHIVANNQIGFTTTPAEARTGLYCTDVAKSIQAPIIHVNADEPELVNSVLKMAMKYREKFHKDIFVDIIGYRRYGHNEQDQPSFTQPMMYH